MQRPYLEGLAELCSQRTGDECLLVLFLGSSIGNFEREEAVRFLTRVRGLLRPGDALLLGADLVKPVAQLLAAYDDPAGVTAAFNLNLLGRINRELNGNFELRQFRHAARWRGRDGRIEMHLRSQVRQIVERRQRALRVVHDRAAACAKVRRRTGWRKPGRLCRQSWSSRESVQWTVLRVN